MDNQKRYLSPLWLFIPMTCKFKNDVHTIAKRYDRLISLLDFELMLWHGSKFSSTLESLRSCKQVFNQALGLNKNIVNDTCSPVSRRTYHSFDSINLTIKKTLLSNQLDYFVSFWQYQRCVADACLIYFLFPISN